MPMKRQKRSAVEGCTDLMWDPACVGPGLARDSVASVWLMDRGACIAGKPAPTSWRVGLACSP